jgi:hypothetical protein
MLAAIKAGEIDVKVSRSGLSITRAELLYKAAQQWPFSVIEGALGAHAASRLPAAGMRMRALPFLVHQYAADALEYLAPKRGLSVEQLLAQILDAYSIQHAFELLTTSRPTATRSEPHRSDHRARTPPSERIGGRETMTPFAWNIRDLHCYSVSSVPP